MKQTLQLKLGQQLTMTPQLQQAIRLLQLSTLDLQQEIQEALDSNMMLETIDEDGAQAEEPRQSDGALEQEPEEITSEGSQTDIPDELPIDSTWEDVYDSLHPLTLPAAGAELPDFESQRSTTQTLQDHLLWQMELVPFSERDHAIAIAIIDAINSDGYLGSPLDDIHQGLSEQLENLEPDEVYTVLHRIQNFDPPGVAATDLGECLRIQLQQLPDDHPSKKSALHLVTHFLDKLAAQDQSQLKRLLDLSDEALHQVILLIRSLNPYPGRFIEASASQFVIPDVFVRRLNGAWQVSLNPDIAPKLRVNPFYSSLIKRADKSTDNVCMKHHLQEARWFIKSLQSRSETVLKVARYIVAHQNAFLEHGPIAMKPLVLREIAEAADMHESTISRVTTQKFMHTPKGIFEFKYFFSSHVSTAGGGECSSTAIKAFIKELIASENAARPLSDNKISDLLKKKGINVARRTIAKYREGMSIPPSNQRKRVF
jgi:RNA polymerase sigma-54 factor